MKYIGKLFLLIRTLNPDNFLRRKCYLTHFKYLTKSSPSAKVGFYFIWLRTSPLSTLFIRLSINKQLKGHKIRNQIPNNFWKLKIQGNVQTSGLAKDVPNRIHSTIDPFFDRLLPTWSNHFGLLSFSPPSLGNEHLKIIKEYANIWPRKENSCQVSTPADNAASHLSHSYCSQIFKYFSLSRSSQSQTLQNNICNHITIW